MADNKVSNPGVGGATFATDDIGGIDWPFAKLAWGPRDTANEVDDTAGKRWPVNVGQSVLPTGAATSALQTQPGVDIGDVTLNNAAGAGAVNIQDGGNSITVDGTISVSGTVTVDTEMPAAAALADATANPTTPLIGAALEGYNGTTWDRLRSDTTNGLDVDVTRVSGVVHVDDNAGSLTVDSTQLPAALVGGRLDENIGAWLGSTAPTVGSKTSANSVPVVVASDQGAIPVSQSGTWNVGTVTTVTGITNVVHVDDNAGSLTVDGTVAVSSVGGTVTVDSELPAAAALADATANPTVPAVGAFGMGYNGATWDRVRTANTGRLQVDVITAPASGGGTQFAEDAAHVSGDIGTEMLGVRRDAETSSVSTDGDYHTMLFDDAGGLKSMPSVRDASGSLGALNASVTLDTKGYGGWTGQVINSGTFVGNLQFQVSNDNTNWAASQCFNPGTATFSSTFNNTTLPLIVQPVLASFRFVRVTVTSYTSGSCTATLHASNQLSMTSLSSSGATLTVTGNITDNNAFSDGSTSVVPIGYYFDEVAGTALTENDMGAARMDSKRAIVVTLEDVTTRGTRAAVTANGLQIQQTTATNLNAQVVGTVAQGSAASGNPEQVAGSLEIMADSAPTNRTTTRGNVDRFSVTDGALFVINTGPQTWTFNTTGVQTGATVHSAPGANLSLYITDITFSIASATASSAKVTISAGADLWGPHYLEAVNGRGCVFKPSTPLKVTTNTALLVTTTGAAVQTITIGGFTAPG